MHLTNEVEHSVNFSVYLWADASELSVDFSVSHFVGNKFFYCQQRCILGDCSCAASYFHCSSTDYSNLPSTSPACCVPLTSFVVVSPEETVPQAFTADWAVCPASTRSRGEISTQSQSALPTRTRITQLEPEEERSPANTWFTLVN